MLSSNCGAWICLPAVMRRYAIESDVECEAIALPLFWSRALEAITRVRLPFRKGWAEEV